MMRRSTLDRRRRRCTIRSVYTSHWASAVNDAARDMSGQTTGQTDGRRKDVLRQLRASHFCRGGWLHRKMGNHSQDQAKYTDFFDMHHLTYGISSLLHSVNLHSVHSPPGSPHPARITSSKSPPSLSPSVTASTFHSRIKPHLFQQESPADADKPARRESMPKLLQFDMKTSSRQVNDLFEVMQQPTAPSGEWYWLI